MTDRAYTFEQLCMQRYAARNYKQQAIAQEVLQTILEAARLAPSAVNYQPWHFVVVRDAQLLQQLCQKVYPRQWFATAPCCIVVCGNRDQSWHRASDGKDHCDIDIAIATEHLALAAAEQGVGSCWVCNFDVEACRELLQLPRELEPMVLLPMGYTADVAPSEKKRKTIEEIVTWR